MGAKVHAQRTTEAEPQDVDEAVAKKPAKVKKDPKPKITARVAYKFIRDIDEATDKFNPQQAVLMNVMKANANADGVVAKEVILNELTDEMLNTRQGKAKILAFYIPIWVKGKPAVMVADAEGKPTDVVKKAAIAPLLEITTVA